MFRADDGRLFDIKNFTPFETSDPFPETADVHADAVCVPLRAEKGQMFIVQGWRFTSERWPHPKDLQQVATLYSPQLNTFFARATLQTLLTIPGVYNERDRKAETMTQTVFVYSGDSVEVRLTESIVRGAGLRVHFYGLTQRVVL